MVLPDKHFINFTANCQKHLRTAGRLFRRGHNHPFILNVFSDNYSISARYGTSAESSSYALKVCCLHTTMRLKQSPVCHLNTLNPPRAKTRVEHRRNRNGKSAIMTCDFGDLQHAFRRCSNCTLQASSGHPAISLKCHRPSIRSTK